MIYLIFQLDFAAFSYNNTFKKIITLSKTASNSTELAKLIFSKNSAPVQIKTNRKK